MTRLSTRADVRRRLPAGVAVGALAVLALTATAPAAIAAPPVRAHIVDGSLRIAGGPFADQIALTVSAADPNELQLDVNADRSPDATFDLRTLNSIVINAGGGDDTVQIAFATTKPTVVAGGRGDDTLIGGGGVETFFGGSGDDTIDGNGGADVAFLGDGDDTFIWDPGDGSDVVNGDSGSDSMVFNGAGGNEIMAATANNGRVLFTRNLGTITMDLGSIEAVDVRALGGTDTVTVNDLTSTDLRRVDVDLAGALGGATADGAADTVVVKGTEGNDEVAIAADGGAVEVRGLSALVRVTHADAALDHLTVDTLGGLDASRVDPAANALIQVAVQ